MNDRDVSFPHPMLEWRTNLERTMRANPPFSVRANRRGLTLIEAAMVLAVASLVVGGLSLTLGEMSENNRARAVADRLTEITDAAAKYVNANQGALTTQTVGGTVKVVIPVGRTTATGAVPAGPGGLPSVQGGGFLPSSFVDADAFNQNHQVVVEYITTGTPHLEAMVVSYAGNPIPDRLLGVAARFAGAQAGFRLTNNVGAISNANIYGTAGGWFASPGTWTAGGITPSSAHMFSMITTLDNSIAGNFLSRLPGIAEANTMRTDIHMAGNAIDSAKSICADSDSASCTTTAPNDGSTLQIGPNIAVPGNITAGGDITGRNATFTGNEDISGNDTVKGNSAINGNLTVGTGYGVGGVLAATTQMNAPAYCDALNCNYEVVPSGTSKLNDLQTKSLSLDTVVYSTGWAQTGALAQSQGYTLGDLLPHYVAQYAYFVGDYLLTGQFVPKPTCGTNGVPKIILHPVTESFAFTPNVNWTYAGKDDTIGYVNKNSANNATDPVAVGPPPGYAGGYVPTQIMTEFDPVDHGTYIDKTITAKDLSPVSAWAVQISGSPDVPTSTDYESTVIAMTYCFYQ